LTELNRNYRNIYILESRKFLSEFIERINFSEDLILTFDFGLKKLVESIGGNVFYIDNLCSQEEMQKNNLNAAEFLKIWHKDSNGNDIFTLNGIDFGIALRIEMWTEFLHHIRIRSSLENLKIIKYKKIFLASENRYVTGILNHIGLAFEAGSNKPSKNGFEYFFDDQEYMRATLHERNFKAYARIIFKFMLSNISFYFDKIFINKSKKKVYIQPYHPTFSVIENLAKDKNLLIVTSSLVAKKGFKKFFSQRIIPVHGNVKNYRNTADDLLENFKKNRSAKFISTKGIDYSHGIYEVIEQQISPRIPEALRMLKSAIYYAESWPIDLEVLIVNIGLEQTIVDCVLKKKGVTTYLIANGMLTSTFGDESMHADHINSYGEVIKRDYFRNEDKVVCLGDPRMDGYIDQKKYINRVNPIIVIGTAAFNSIDLNSYVAFEFEFMFEVLTAFNELKKSGHIFSIIIKVRPNGVLDQYKSFVSEYFNGLGVELVRETPMIEVLKRADLYISFYSQTLFEASCLGIPVIYYKKDSEIINSPFDGKSELVTIYNVEELKSAFLDYQDYHIRFNEFLKYSIMEKYIGPIDGLNTKRNLDYIYQLIGN
jgi:hypothetical protein